MSLNVKVIVSLTNVRRLYLLPNGQEVQVYAETKMPLKLSLGKYGHCISSLLENKVLREIIISYNDSLI